MKLKLTLSLLAGLTIFGGCKNNTIVENNDVGSFRGNVALVSAMGDTLSNYAGVTIAIEGTTLQATSSATGDWNIENVPAGIYNLLFTKPGFDTLIIPKVEFSGAGVSFMMSTAIQALPMDSLVFTLTNTTEDSITTPGSEYYLGLLTMRGGVVGPDSLEQDFLTVSSDSGFTSDGTITPYLQNDTLVQAAIGYNEPPNKSGTMVTIQGHLLARAPKASFKYFQQATSPYTVTHSIRLP